MELKNDPRCYTDICLNGKWFHYDHCTRNAFMLQGGASSGFQLDRVPETELELIQLLSNVTS